MEEGQFLAQVSPRRFSGNEPIGKSGKTVVDFWRWSSDLLENVQRGIFAEYIVATTLGVSDNLRIGWTGYDLIYGGRKIEVKSSSYIQSWKQRKLTNPTFGIGPREQWDEETGLSSDPRYVADAFVFCLFAHTAPPTMDVLDLGQWRFYVVHTEILRRRFEKAKSISEIRLRNLTASVAFELLRSRLDEVLANPDAFISKEAASSGRSERNVEARFNYAVAQRGTRLNPVIVTAGDYQEAFERARVDGWIASLGSDISAVRLSAPGLEEALAKGAKDLRAGL